MAVEAQTLPKTGGPPPKRRFRNFLLNPRFQLKYTGMVVAVTVVIASVLGWRAYEYSTNLTAAVTASDLAMEMDPDAQALLIAESQSKDREVLLSVVGGILILAVALGFTGIIVTHRVVGPSYKLRRLIGDVADGHLRVQGRLRKGDELQDVFEAFERMVKSLRDRQQREVDLLDAAIKKARDAGTPEDALADIVEARERMASELD